ncbi:hypothetical protein KR018_010521, partial [Drosophila ironensis]
RKTRTARRQEMEATAEKAPGSPGKAPGSETPRRSCRKSVRPAMDYDDIVRSAKKLIPVDSEAEEEPAEAAAHKWNVAEVGRSQSRKRTRKSKRGASRKPKTDQEEDPTPLPEALEAEGEEKELQLVEKIRETPGEEEDIPKSSSKVANKDIPAEQSPIRTSIVNDEDIEELGICPLSQESVCEAAPVPILPSPEKEAAAVQEVQSPLNTTFDRIEEEDLEEMPSLIVIDDEDENKETSKLNTTFDLEDAEKKDQSVIVVEELAATAAPQKPSALLKCNLPLPKVDEAKENVSKGYRFPTPFKTKPSFAFEDDKDTLEDENTIFDEHPEPLLVVEDVKCKLRRSKSIDVLTKKVSFRSPIETAIHKLTANKIRSIAKINTPSKRLKVPNFAAIHEKQFAKMENLVDHMERKAERAKALTNSSVKQAPGSTAKKAKAAERPQTAIRPQALRKIDLAPKPAPVPAVTTATPKQPAASRLPLRSTANVSLRPAFNLSTAVVTSFNSTLASATRPEVDKLAQRRKRHQEMFKGRVRDQANKAEIIRGVRSNRRFELQMQHRRHITEE